MNDHDPDDADLIAWLADGKAPAGVCPHCGSTVSVVQHGGFRARCSHRRCGASGPLMRTITRAVDAFYRPPGYVERHMGIHPSSLTDVVSVLEYDRDATARERDEARVALAEARGLLLEAQSWFARTSFSGSEPEFVSRIAAALEGGR